MVSCLAHQRRVRSDRRARNDRRDGSGRPPVAWARGALVALGLVVGACNVDTTGTPPSLVPHCKDLDQNQTCLADYTSRPFCNTCVPASQFQGCVGSLPPVSCSPDGTTSQGTGSDPTTTAEGTASESSTGDASTTLAPADTSGDSSTTDAPVTCNAAGALDDACIEADPAAGYCVDSSCVSCVDAGGASFCAGLDPLQPACDEATGRCEPCGDAAASVCGGATPVCGASGACQACTAHSECEAACHLAPSDPHRGECFATDQMLWVAAMAPCPGLGTEDSPACSLRDTIALVPPNESWTIFVQGGLNYAEQIVIADATVAILGAGNAQITGAPTVNEPIVTVDDAILYIDSARVRGNTSTHGMVCGDGGTLWLDGVQVRNNIGYGVYLTGPCDVTLRRSSILRNVGGGVRQYGGALVLDNASVVSNGDGTSGPGINLQFASLRALYSTIAGNNGVGPDSIHCLNSTGEVRNSIVSGAATSSIEIDCFVLEMQTNALDTASFVEAGSVAVGAYTSGWFINPNEGDVRLSNPPNTPFGGVALWLPGDPPLDADGTARPVGGVLGYVGVDEP